MTCTAPSPRVAVASAQRGPGDDAAWRGRAGGVVRIVSGAAIVVGAVLRLWFLFHESVNSDESVVGMAAHGILHGQFRAFYPGQVYGGVEPYVTAVLFGLFGQSAITLKLTAVVLAVAATVVVWRIALRLVPDRALALLAATLFWVAPMSVVWNSTIERGFRGVTMLCGLACVLLALRILDGSTRSWEFLSLGAFIGLGWWSSPEIVYLLVPAGLLVVGAVVGGAERARVWLLRAGTVVAAAVVAALPWLWANVRSGFESLHTSALSGAFTPAGQDFGTRLGALFHHAVPMLFDLLRPMSGVALFGTRVTEVLHYAGLLLVVVALALCALRRGRALAVVVGVVAFPFLYAWQPGTWFWQDGRYAVYVTPLLVLVLAAGAQELADRVARRAPRGRHAARRSLSRSLMAAVVTLGAALSVVSLRESVPVLAPQAHGVFASWGDPEAPTKTAIARLEAKGVTTGFADYWVAYDLDFVSGGRLNVTPIDNARFASIDHRADRDPRAAWLFVAPAEMPTAYGQFGLTGEVVGPDGETEAAFESILRRRHDPYRVVDAGLLRAVVPVRPVPPSQGAPG